MFTNCLALNLLKWVNHKYHIKELSWFIVVMLCGDII